MKHVKYDTTMPSINYVIAAWTGPRQADHVYDDYYIQRHLQYLQRFRHNLDQITIVLPLNNIVTPEYLRNMRRIRHIQGTPVEIIARENRGISYGCYSDAFLNSRGEFDYYIFMEDDYVFTKHDFDKVLVDMIEERENCGFLCGLVLDKPKIHAAISNGIAKAEAMEKIIQKYGMIPHFIGEKVYNSHGQINFSWSFVEAGYTLEDVTDRYRAPFLNSRYMHIKEYAEDQEEYLWQPMQQLEPRVPLVPRLEAPPLPKP